MPDDPRPLSPEEVDALLARHNEGAFAELTDEEIYQLFLTVRDRERQRDAARRDRDVRTEQNTEAAFEYLDLKDKCDELQRQLVDVNTELDKTAAILGDALGGGVGTCSKLAQEVAGKLAEAHQSLARYLREKSESTQAEAIDAAREADIEEKPARCVHGQRIGTCDRCVQD